MNSGTMAPRRSARRWRNAEARPGFGDDALHAVVGGDRCDGGIERRVDDLHGACGQRTGALPVDEHALGLFASSRRQCDQQRVAGGQRGLPLHLRGSVGGRGDAGDDAAAVQAQLVALTGGAGQGLGGELLPRLHRERRGPHRVEPGATRVERGRVPATASARARAASSDAGGTSASVNGTAVGEAVGAEAVQVVRPAGLGAGARQAFAAERLHADHRADHVAVDVDVADARPRRRCAARGCRCASGCPASGRSRAR